MSNLSTASKPPLIADRIKNKIVETVSMSKLTIIVGPTGSGKSTLIPPLLLDGLNGRILCSQPRRLAVVAISKRVAEERNVTLGGSQVGYHVGNHNFSTKKTELLFTTAGILLEELRNNGVEALTKFKCVIIDECHERSPESDLVLALVKQFMQTHPREDIRLVLMSATFDHKRYASYFRDVPGCSTVDTITLETAESFDAFHNQVSTFYLNDLPLPESKLEPHKNFIRVMRNDPDHDLHHCSGKTLSDSMLGLIRTLVSWLDNEEEDESSPFLIFAPTYRHLEQLYNTLVYVNGSSLELSVLHSAVDIEDCIRTMTSGLYTGRRRVLLASAIADSSVTVPGVSAVIDLCRALEVRWDVDTRTYAAKTVWCSKSIADQRRGRTGRTCPGQVFRLVHRNFYIQRLEQWDVPQLTLSACHNETLAMVCADDKLNIDDPRQLFQKCLDPPDGIVVDDAIDYLVEIDACQKVKNEFAYLNPGAPERILPTDYGSLVSSLSMNVSEARIVLEGARLGLLHETLALMAIYNHRPSPIVHHFSKEEVNNDILESYYDDVEANSAPSLALANLSAYIYWDSHWNHDHNIQNMEAFRDMSRLDYISHGDEHAESRNPWKWTAKTEMEHMTWCRLNDLNPTSMRSVAEIIESAMNVFYLSKHEPEWLRCCNPTPRWKRRSDWDFDDEELLGRNMLRRVYGDDVSVLCEALTKLVTSRSAFASRSLAEEFLGVPPSSPSRTPLTNMNNRDKPMACIHFLKGNCTFGEQCRHSHSRHARRPPCRFFLSGGCSKGADCLYSHGDADEQAENARSQYGPTDPLVPIVDSLHVSAPSWFKAVANQLLLLGEGNFQFTKALTANGNPPLLSSSMISSTKAPSGALSGVDATRLHLNRNVNQLVRKKGVRCFGWNFPYTGAEEDATAQEVLILNTLQSIALLFDGYPYFNVSLGLTLQGDQFSRWNVTRSAMRTGFRLISWSDFDHDKFPGYLPCRENGEAFPVDNARFYVLQRQKFA